MKLMGILNTTPDSFFAPSRVDVETGVNLGLQLEMEGANLLDIGGESTRPGSLYVEAEEEIHRVVPLITALRAAGCKLEISVDTRKRKTAEASILAGASWINDVSALEDDPEMAELIADTGVKIVLMHRQGHPDSMQLSPRYEDVVAEVSDFLLQRVEFALSKKIKDSQIVLDPGFGFGKTVQNNIDLMRNLSHFCCLGFPILVGVSRKTFLGSYTGASAQARLPASLAAAIAALQSGVSVLRVHDIGPTAQALLAWKSFSRESSV